MQKDVEILLQVQEKDVQIIGLKKEIDAMPRELNEVKHQLESAEEEYKKAQEDYKQAQAKKKEIEIDLETKQESIKKYETQLFQIKTNEEYKAMQKQISDLKFQCGFTEDNILEKMEEIEKSQAIVKEKENLFNKEKTLYSEKEKEVAKKKEVLEGEVKKLLEERNEIAKGVPADFLAKYEVIFNNKHGAALVSVDLKSCHGCHMKLPPNVINDVRRGTSVIVCDNCSRILYWIEPEKEEK